jgi:FAD:protein FMN transferase
MKQIKCLFWLSILLLCIGCGKSDNAQSEIFYGVAMTVPYKIVIGKDLSSTEIKQVKEIIRNVFEEIHQTFNKWNPDSELSILNRSEANQKIPLSKSLESFLHKTDKLMQLTEGKFDPTIESVQKIWKKHMSSGKIPMHQDLQKAAEAVGWNKIHFSKGYFWKDQALTELDLGGIAKGFAIDCMIEKLNAAGFIHAYVEWGGEIRTSGSHPENRPWRIFVSQMGDPDPSKALATIDMQNNAVASSGDYLQNWTIDGTTYFHIIHPKTCRPLISTENSICSVTIVAPNCMLADLLATSAMLFDTPHQAEVWLKKIQKTVPDIRFWIATKNSVK